MNAFAYHWNNYLMAGGKKLVELFDKVINKDISALKEANKAIKELHGKFCPDRVIVDECYCDIEQFIVDCKKIGFEEYLENGKKYTAHTGLKCLEEECRVANSDIRYTDEDLLGYFCDNIAYETLSLALQKPDLFIPYFFLGNFNILTYIAAEFNISLLPLPAKKDHLERFYYYADICDAFEKFRFDNKLSAAELWAFLYDYAPCCVGLADYINKNLTQPRSAFLIGGSPNDSFINEDITIWQCSPDTRAGDMIVMYITSPESRIGKVWRSVSAGFNDPFFWYYRCTYIGMAQEINGMTLAQMRTDDIWGKLPIVRKNMQGVNGTEITPGVYNYMIDKADSHIMKIECAYKEADVNICNEHDVEIQLIEPLLEKLGWRKRDYVTQMNISLGSGGDRLIPDYVILPVDTPHHERGLYVIEAKMSITGEKQLEAAKGQVRSYARQLTADKAVVISREAIWVTSYKDDYDRVIFHCIWGELANADTFHSLFSLIGNDKTNI